MDIICQGIITQGTLANYANLSGYVERLNQEIKTQKQAIQAALDAGIPVEPCGPGGHTAFVQTSSRIVPAWKEIALNLGANEERIREATTPSVIRALVVERPAIGVIATPRIYPSVVAG